MNKKTLIPFIDVLFILLCVFVSISSLLKHAQKEAEASVSANVLYQVIMDWEGASKTDMDLWTKDPQGHVVGFNNREGGEGSLCSLAHDDLGARNDQTTDKSVVQVNQEIISIRGALNGEYTANGHCYAKDQAEGSLKVKCRLVKIKPFKEIISVEREFKSNGDEVTFFRFKFDRDGNIENTNELPQKFVTLNKGEEGTVDMSEFERK